jgi:hypothetical protein
MAAVCSSTRSAWATICAPSGVTETSEPPRSNKVTPSSSSSFLMATDKVGCATKQASAAWPKCRARATATMYFSSVRVMGVRITTVLLREWMRSILPIKLSI